MVPFWQFGLVGIVGVALVTDLQNRKIYNWLTFPAMLAGLVLNTVLGGLQGLESSAIGLLVGSAVFLVGFFMGAMGAGDVKLMAAVGAFIGPVDAAIALLFTFIAGGVFALAWLMRKRGARFPYAPAVCAGTLACLALRHPFSP
jgi:prepilin peptidase CpaA